MNNSSPTQTTASSLPARKITRQQVAAHCGLCVRTIDELTRTGVLGHFKIGKSIRYDLAEVEATLRERFHVRPTAQADAPVQTNAGQGAGHSSFDIRAASFKAPPAAGTSATTTSTPNA